MVDWTQAVTVAVTGVISVFLALAILQIAITISGRIIGWLQKRQTKKSNATG